jgi:hypothetical protein
MSHPEKRENPGETALFGVSHAPGRRALAFA